MNTEENKEYYTEVHNQIIGWTGNCDTKASIVLAFVGVLVSITFTSEYLLTTIDNQVKNIILYWNDGIGQFSLIATLMFITLIGLAISMSCCCCFVIKSLKANIKCIDNSIIFFGKIANLSKEQYINRVKMISVEDYHNDKLSQIHNCATICDTKFKLYNKSIKHLMIGLLFFISFILSVIILNAS